MKIDLLPTKQEKSYTCLPACLKIVLHHLGSSFKESEIANACNTTRAGTTIDNAIHAVHSLGFNATEIEEATLEDLIYYLNHNNPVIVFIRIEHLPYGNFGTHAIIVSGFEGEEIIYIDTVLGRERRLDLITFLKTWRSRGRKGIVVYK